MPFGDPLERLHGFGAEKNAGEGVVIGLCNGVEFVVMAAGAADG